jgi:hypothetical protein
MTNVSDFTYHVTRLLEFRDALAKDHPEAFLMHGFDRDGDLWIDPRLTIDRCDTVKIFPYDRGVSIAFGKKLPGGYVFMPLHDRFYAGKAPEICSDDHAMALRDALIGWAKSFR